MKHITSVLTGVLALSLTACGASGAATGESAATPTESVVATADQASPIPPLPEGVGVTTLKYRILDEFPDFFFCDPDFYPVARADELDLARQRFPELQANPEAFTAILTRHNLTGQTQFTDDEMLLIYRDHKKLAAIPLEPAGAGYRFQIQVAQAEGDGELVSGVIDAQGVITVEQRESIFATCPICLAVDTLIDAPDGAVAVQNLRPGMIVWTLDSSGQRTAVPVMAVGKTVVPASHTVIHVVLGDGREISASAGHPTADGRTFGDLHAGDWLDGARIVSAARIPYAGGATYDLLPAGETGFYWANGVLIGSTLAD